MTTYGRLPIRAIDDDIVREYRRAGSNDGTIPALRAMFNDAARADAGRLVTVNPFAGLRLPQSRGRRNVQPPAEADAQRMIALADELTRASLAAYLDVSIHEEPRPGELDALRWDDFDFTPGAESICIERQWNVNARKLTLPKHGVVRTVAMTPWGGARVSVSPMRRSPLVHRALVGAVRMFNRNPWASHRLELVLRDAKSFVVPGTYPVYAEDFLWVGRRYSFVEDERFQEAYERAVRAGGYDYGIRWRVHTILWAASNAARLGGAFVECGTGRGFFASAICEYVKWADRPFYLYDTFEPTLNSGLSPFYANSVDEVRANFAQWPGVRLVVGELPGTLTDSPERVAFLHVDLNQAPPEQAVVRHFWPRMVPGAVLVYDDYGFPEFEASGRAADELGAELGFSILASPTGQGIVVKGLDPSCDG